MHMEKKNGYKIVMRAILSIMYAGLIGYLLYRFIPDLCGWAYVNLAGTGPLVIVVYILLVVLAFLGAVPVRALSKNRAIRVVCGLIMGVPITVKFAIMFWNGLLGSFTGVMFIVCGLMFICVPPVKD